MRLDVFLTFNKYYPSRTKATQAIERGEIYVDGEQILKPAFEISEDFSGRIEKKAEIEFVSLGGYKLQKGLTAFNFSVKDTTCIDLGASTGGFTHCLILNGAKKVYAVDLNDNLLDERLKQDDRVVSIIKNAKDLEKKDFSEKIDIITADLSFISEKIILPIISSLLTIGGYAIVLIKPQFENDAKIKFKNGIVRDKKIHKNVCKKIFDVAVDNGLSPKFLTMTNSDKNKNDEFLMFFEKEGKISLNLEEYKF